jgi:solute carrier family 44 (choline transporter-like protein), member 2/4/5
VAYINEHVPALNYYMVPVFVIAIGSYFIASVFFNVYAIAVDTLFLCFRESSLLMRTNCNFNQLSFIVVEDSERNDGSEEKPYFMSRKLMAILSKKNK